MFAATSEVHGDPQCYSQRVLCGHGNPVPRGIYNELKRFVETLVTAHIGVRGTNAGIIRLFNTYGSRMRADDGRVVRAFITAALRGRPLAVTGDSRRTRTLTYVADTVAGVLLMAASRPTDLGNIRGNTELPILHLAALAAVCDADADIEFTERTQDDPYSSASGRGTIGQSGI